MANGRNGNNQVITAPEYPGSTWQPGTYGGQWRPEPYTGQQPTAPGQVSGFIQDYLTGGGQALRDRFLGLLGGVQGQFQPNQYLQQAGQQLLGGAQQPSLWGTAQEAIRRRLDPGYSAFVSPEQDPAFQAYLEQINRQTQEAARSTAEALNLAGLYRSGLLGSSLSDIEESRQRAIADLAAQRYLAGQQATQMAQSEALQAALALGGQQAALGQQNLANLLGLGQFMQQMQQQQQLLPLQAALQVYGSVYQPEAMAALQAQLQEAQRLQQAGQFGAEFDLNRWLQEQALGQAAQQMDWTQWLGQQQLSQQASQMAFDQWLARQQLALQQAELQAYLNQLAAQQQAQAQAGWGNLLGSLITSAGYVLGGPLGAQVGNWLGNLFGGR